MSRLRHRDNVYLRRESDLQAQRVGSYHELRPLTAAGRKWIAALDVEPWRRRADGSVMISAQDFCALIAKAQASGLIMVGQFRPGLADLDREPDAGKPPPKLPWIW
jgi:hypothetical protein